MYTDTFNLIVQVNHLLSNKQTNKQRQLRQRRKGGNKNSPPPPFLPILIGLILSFKTFIFFTVSLNSTTVLHSFSHSYFYTIFSYSQNLWLTFRRKNMHKNTGFSIVIPTEKAVICKSFVCYRASHIILDYLQSLTTK